MFEKLIPALALAGLVALYIMGNQVLAIVFAFTILISYVAMTVLEWSGKKSASKTDSKCDVDDD